MAKRKDPYDLKNVWKLLLGLIGIGVFLFALMATIAAFQQSTDYRSQAATSKCIPRPACLDNPDPKKRCTRLQIPNVCRPTPRTSPYTPQPKTSLPAGVNVRPTLYLAPTGKIVQDCRDLQCLDGGTAVSVNGFCQCPRYDL